MSEAAIRVAVTGVAGRMGRQLALALGSDRDFELVLAVDRSNADESLRDLCGPAVANLVITSKLGAGLDDARPDVLVDLTHHAAATSNAISALQRKVPVVIGTSGISKDDLRTIELATEEHATPALLAPNFAIGAVLMMQFAEAAAKWLPDAEIIEMHHEQKVDAPSGTARSTAERIAAARGEFRPRRVQEVIKTEGVRGGEVDSVHVHSVRLPGLVAHQAVMFGGIGETLTIRHDSMDRASFMEGIKLCIRGVRSLKGFVVGMEHVMGSL